MERCAVFMAVGVLVWPLLAAAHSLVVRDNKVGIEVFAHNAAKSARNLEEEGKYFEDDIFIPSGQNRSLRNGIMERSKRWPNAVVPYEIVGEFTKSELEFIRHAFNEYHTKTCVRFKERINERDYIAINKNETNCFSSVGRQGGPQKVNLESPRCLLDSSTTQHELMHTLGFYHEQTRLERDNYIMVLMENVEPNMSKNFKKQKKTYGFGVPYDYASIMHYPGNAFSQNGQPTMVALKKTKASKMMGRQTGLSAGDVIKINKMYGCS